MPDGSDKNTGPKRDGPPDLAWRELPEERPAPGEVTVTAAELAAEEAESKAAARAEPPAWLRAERAHMLADLESGLINPSDPDPEWRALARRFRAAKARGEVIDGVALYNAHEDDPDTYADAATEQASASASAADVAVENDGDDPASAGATQTDDVAPEDDDTPIKVRQRRRLRAQLIAEREAPGARAAATEDFVPDDDTTDTEIPFTPRSDADQAAWQRWQELERIKRSEKEIRRVQLAEALRLILEQVPPPSARGKSAAAREAKRIAIRRQYLRMLDATEKYVLIEVDQIARELAVSTTTAAVENRIPKSAFTGILMADHGYPGKTAELVWRKFSRVRERVGLEPCVVSNSVYWPGRRPVFRRPGETHWLFNLWRAGVEIAPLPVSDDQADVTMFRRLIVHLFPYAEWDQAVMTWFLADALARRGEAKITWATLLISCPGAGKGSLYAAGAAVFGRGNAHIQPGAEALRNNENHIYVYSEWSVLEDLYTRVAGARPGQAEDGYEVLKPVISDGKIWVKQKYVSGYDADTYGRMSLFSNHSDTLAIPADDRRLLVLQGNRTDKLPAEIATWAHALQHRPAACGRLLRWLMDQREPLGEKYGFTPFDPPVPPPAGPDQLSASARLREDIREETLPADTFLARAVAEDLRERQKRTVITAREVTNLAVRRRAGPGGDTSGIRLSTKKVTEGLKLAGFQLAGRPRNGGGRSAVRERLYALDATLSLITDLPEADRLAALMKQLQIEQMAEDFRE